MALQFESHVPVTQTELPWALRQGAVAGVVAGLVFAAFEMMASAAMMGAEGFLVPLRMIGAILIGPQALDPGYSLATAAAVGVVVHMVLAIIYGMVFAALAGGLRSLPVTVGAASAFGLALWVINFYLIAPLAFPWFLESSPAVQFIAHTFFFGSVLGYWVWQAHEQLLRGSSTAT